MYHVVLAESALETVPNSIASHPAVMYHAQRLGRDVSQILLDKSWHYAAMKGMQDVHKRGRPDLVHFSILSAIATPLYQRALMKLYIHTIQDMVYTVCR
jgi:rRNA small subunit pseudouridine methyltransferase Nep1